MTQPLWSIWDNFGARDRAYANVKIQRPTHFNEFRCRDRVRDVAALAGGSAGAPSAGALASDLQRRRSHWLDELDSGRAQMHPGAIRPRWVRNTVFGGCMVLSIVIVGIWMTQMDRPWILATLLFIGIPPIVFWPLLQETRRTAREFAARFRARQCPDCGNDLSAMRPAIDAEALHGHWVGPAACPKCGVPWPMVPPPVPADRSTELER